MAIQHRRGLEKNYAPDKTLPGEISVVLDAGSAYLCFSAGNVKRIATHEDMLDIVLGKWDELYDKYKDLITETIHNAQSATTHAESAATWADRAAESADRAADEATAAAQEAQQAAAEAWSATEESRKATDQAIEAAGLAESAAYNANEAAEKAEDVTERAEAALWNQEQLEIALAQVSALNTCDGENPHQRKKTVIHIDGGTPYTRAHPMSRIFDGKTPSDRMWSR